MIVQMDKVSVAPSRERAQRLYEKNIELENKRRKSIQARVPLDPNTWQQMRENYETIILDDHNFAEQHNIEYALWQLHYRCIEELRSHFQSALSSTSTGSNASQVVRVPGRPERITKIRQQFRTFLSEAAGFYHDLILKIRAKHGLPLGYFSEDSDSRVIKEKDGKKPVEVKNGLVSCHRCLIYLGDLARYKGLYGDGDSKTREYTTASSYYMQAASLWPSSGNPHHQLAILASYSGNELVAVYRYFRSLAAEHPFVTARDNLIVAFEKNRQSYSELLGDVNLSLVKDSPANLNGKGRGRSEVKHASKKANSGTSVEDRTSNIPELQKSFCIRFVRLNGILFTRTSLETFPEVLASVSQAFGELLSSGEERLPFGGDAAENGLFLVRLMATLIFTIHNVKKEADGQSYAEIVQRAVLLQNAFIAAFELMGHILQRVAQLPDPSSSSLLPCILVCLEWLACNPDVASGVDVDEKQGIARVNFWNHCIMFLNTILPFSSMSSDDNKDETCFYNMTPYEEGETENHLALWEDYELRGFLPLFPAQTVLDFSRSDGKKEKSARIKRILAAGKALVNLVKVDQQMIRFDSRMKKFTMGTDPHVLDDGMIPDANVTLPNALNQEKCDRALNSGVVEPHPQVVDSEEEDEVIVFKPLASEKSTSTPQSPKLVQYDNLRAKTNASVCDLQLYANNASTPLDQHQKQFSRSATTQLPMSNGNIIHQQAQPLSAHTSKWLADEAASLANNLKAVRFVDNGHMMEHGVQRDMAFTHPITRQASVQPYNADSISMFYGLSKVPEPMVPSQINNFASSGTLSESLAVKTSAPLQNGMRKSPVSRPVRHLGPPPGFSHVPPKQVVEPISSSGPRTNILPVADYSWLDSYPLPPPTSASGLNNFNDVTLNATQQFMNNNGFVGMASFPFPGKQGPPAQIQAESMKGWENYKALEHLRAQEQQLRQQLMNGNQHSTPTPEQYHGQSTWNGRYIV